MPVYQEKNKNKLPKSGYSWYYRCYYTDMYGNRKQKQSKMYSRRTLAKDAEMDFLSKIRTTDEVDYNISFEYVYNEWLEYKKKTIKETVYYSLKKNLDKNVFKFFRNYKLHNIKSNIINEWHNFINNTNLSLKYKNTIIGYLKEFFKYAEINYEFDKKITAKIIPYKITSCEKKLKDSEWNYWTYEEFQTFIKSVDNNYYNLIFNFLYYTGLRIGELLALRWKNINLTNKTIKIEDNFTNKLGIGTYKIIEPKTKNSIRVVDLDDSLAALLTDYKNMQKNIYNFNDEWFMSGNIRPTSCTSIARYLKKYIQISKVKHITLHGFRHSHVSLLIDLGCDVRDVAKRIGDTVEIVESTYYHMFPKKKAELVNKLNNFKK